MENDSIRASMREKFGGGAAAEAQMSEDVVDSATPEPVQQKMPVKRP